MYTSNFCKTAPSLHKAQRNQTAVQRATVPAGLATARSPEEPDSSTRCSNFYRSRTAIYTQPRGTGPLYKATAPVHMQFLQDCPLYTAQENQTLENISEGCVCTPCRTALLYSAKKNMTSAHPAGLPSCAQPRRTWPMHTLQDCPPVLSQEEHDLSTPCRTALLCSAKKNMTSAHPAGLPSCTQPRRTRLQHTLQDCPPVLSQEEPDFSTPCRTVPLYSAKKNQTSAHPAGLSPCTQPRRTRLQHTLQDCPPVLSQEEPDFSTPCRTALLYTAKKNQTPDNIPKNHSLSTAKNQTPAHISYESSLYTAKRNKTSAHPAGLPPVLSQERTRPR